MKADRVAWIVAVLLPLCAANAGEPPTARIMVNPVPAKVGPPYPPLADGGPNIVGNELRLDAGGVRVWVEVQIADWDPNGDGSPAATGFQVTLDGFGLLDADIDGNGDVTDDGDQEDIVLTRVPCGSNSDCSAAFGESIAKCDFFGEHVCYAVYTDKAGIRSDGWCASPPQCDTGDQAIIRASSWTAFGHYAHDFRPDDGMLRWGATACYDVPPSAKGKYTVELDTDDTFLADDTPSFISTESESGFVINVLTGACCFGLGTLLQGCVDGVTRAECGDQPSPAVFTPEAQCAPDGPDCGIYLGACCDALCGTCQASIAEVSCKGTHSVWTAQASCNNVECTADDGACCQGDPFEPCTDNSALSQCQCPTCAWHKLQRCTDILCPRASIPVASEWGLIVLTLLLMVGAKVAFGHACHGSDEP